MTHRILWLIKVSYKPQFDSFWEN